MFEYFTDRDLGEDRVSLARATRPLKPMLQ